MWRTLLILAGIGTVALETATAQEPQRPYGPFDAIAEGTERSEAQRLSLIDSQLDTVNQLQVAQVGGPRELLRDPVVAAVYPYGRRGILGLRPRGYVVVRSAPTATYRRSNAVEPSPYDLGYDRFGDPVRQAVRQPIGHQLSQTGPNRWEYRPLYAEDDRPFDEAHREIERNLRPLPEGYRTERAGYATEDRRPAGNPRVDEPEELPEPQDLEVGGRLTGSNQASPRRGAARDIGREGADNPTPMRSAPRPPKQPRDDRVPPPPQPDPPDQPRNATGTPRPSPDKPDSTGENELRGPLLQDPSTGAREF